MLFGLFGSAQANSSTLGAGIGQGFHDYIDFNVEAEKLGFYSTFLVEHHFTGWGQVSSTLNLLTWLAARTTTLRVGTATMVLPWHNPVLLAEQAATLELLSGGRLDLGVGKGYRHAEFTGFNIPIEEAEARFEECLDIMLKSWGASERFSHHGKFWNFNDVIVEPNIAQRPAMWMGAGSEPSIRKVASRGFNLLLDQFADAKLTGQRIEFFKQAISEQGRAYNRNEVAVARDLFIAKDEQDKQAAIERLNQSRQRTIDHARAPDKAGGSHILSYSKGGLPPTDSALVGTVEEIREKIHALKEAGAGYLICSILGGSRDTLHRFASEILPEFQTEPEEEGVSA
ncbi:LLM class flavin-dependent oxidoreductase [Burkholderia sp. SCN-KJ]|uniref:LLM class flavin-dependent oxidoreductase n=1 Tax=Burkholderia sp. SCN-KJ TaxID=2969248 RepID=UPI00214FB647|nr:LLM class flavin-dependent oxidoreductase [Burkholderia sp. SCN-KJ]MCR4466216.1 LLM class flavin-dependent oxidoreductase [Burkholderia sp. SCN-KJ]